MTRDRALIALIVVVGIAVLALSVVPALLLPMACVASFAIALRLRTGRPMVAAAWATVGVAFALLTVALALAITETLLPAVNVLMVLSLVVYLLAIALLARAAGRGRRHPVAARVAVVCFGAVLPLAVIGLGAFGRGIALADRGETSPIVEGLLLTSAIGVPTLLVTGVVAGLMTRRRERAGTG